MKQCDTLIHAGIIITQNRKREILTDASLAIAGGRIAAIGPTAEMRKQWLAREILEYQDMLLLPGLINAHTHAAMTFLRGLADDLPLMEWLEKSVFPVESRLRPEIVRLGSLLGYAEMLATGTTACIDMYIFEDAVFEAAEIAGLRCMGGEAVFVFPSAAFMDYRGALFKTRELAERYSSHARLKVAVNPHSVYTTTPEILRECRKLALDASLPVHIHLAETEAETRRCLAATGMRPVEWCAHMGLFEARAVCAHMVDITEAEMTLLAEKGAVAVHNPASNMKLASGVAPVSSMLGAGLPVALGTDGPASNNTLNMFREMSLAALVAKLSTGDPAALPAQAVLDMATLGGARAFGDSALGSLEVGKAADCVALDMRYPNFAPLHNPVSQAVYSTSGYECAMTMVGGEILYRDGKYTRFDYAGLREEIASLRKFVLEKT